MGFDAAGSLEFTDSGHFRRKAYVAENGQKLPFCPPHFGTPLRD
jgi:hypothetical protein